MKIYRLLLMLTVAAIVLSSYMPYPTGAPSPYYYTGSPSDGHSCSSCHAASSNVTGWVTSTIPAGGYVPGTVYQITATNSISGSGKFGFELSPQSATGTYLGQLAAGSGSVLVGSKWITHSNATTSVSSWTFNWTAPTAGTGSVTFYASFARGHPGQVRLSSLTVAEQTAALPGNAGPITGPSNVCSNNSYNYSVATITGATSYVWTVPSGVNITSGQGTTAITTDFTASASSGNVSVHGSNAAGNGVPSNLAVTVSSSPAQPSAVAGQASPCEGSSQVYSVTNVAGINYAWTAPTGSVITAGQGSSSVTLTVGPNNGSVDVVPSNLCGTGNVSSLVLTVGTIPGASSTPAGPDQVDLAFTPTSTYTAAAVPSASGCTWDISPAGAGTISGTGLTATVTWGSFLGTANIRARATNSCGDGTWSTVKQTQVINTTGIRDETASGIRVFPSPSRGQFNIEMKGSSETAFFRILSPTGVELHSGRIPGNGISSVDVQLPSGLYILAIEVNGETVKKKLLIQK